MYANKRDTDAYTGGILMNQEIISIKDTKQICEIIREKNANKIFIVHGNSFYKMKWYEQLDENFEMIHFTDFNINPTYENVMEGRKKFIENKCDLIVAIGGGSAIDVAKSIKFYAAVEYSELNVKSVPKVCETPLIVIPTTAGTGSESTKFAVLYYQGNKISVSDDRILPDIAILDVRPLAVLPIFQRKVTMCDALSHAIESYWSVRSCDESRIYSKYAIEKIMKNYLTFINGMTDADEEMLIAANLAGQAINITTTTAGHAMSYKMTSVYNFPHGQAVIICIPTLWRNMMNSGESEKKKVNELAKIMGFESAEKAAEFLDKLIEELQLRPNISFSETEAEMLSAAVNVERLGNYPVKLTKEDLKDMYIKIFDK